MTDHKGKEKERKTTTTKFLQTLKITKERERERREEEERKRKLGGKSKQGKKIGFTAFRSGSDSGRARTAEEDIGRVTGGSDDWPWNPLCPEIEGAYLEQPHVLYIPGTCPYIHSLIPLDLFCRGDPFSPSGGENQLNRANS